MEGEIMSTNGKHGVTANTPKNILFGAGTIHKGLSVSATSVEYGTIVGATSGGSKLSIVPEVTNIEVDGALVKAKGLAKKTGEVATMEINLIELSTDMLKAAIIGEDGTSTLSTHDLIVSKPDIEEGDYWDSIAFVGKTVEGLDIIVILENALCTSGLELEGKHKEGAVGTFTFECYAELTSDLDTLPYHIYYPKSS